MPLQEIYYIAEMMVGVAVIISIVFVAIELRQNTYLTRKSMADDREHRVNWLMETITTDEDFRRSSTTSSERKIGLSPRQAMNFQRVFSQRRFKSFGTPSNHIAKL